MSRPNTRARIVQAALALFANEGVSNVTLQQIADEVGISVGNLAYHFKHKEELIETVYERGFQALKKVLQHYLQESSLLDFDHQLTTYYHFVEQFHFCYSCNRDIQRNQPELATAWQDQIKKLFLQIRKRLDFYLQKGWLRVEPWAGCYDQLTHNIFLNCCYWLPQQQLLNQAPCPEHFSQAIWAQIRPHFSEEGEAIFRQVITTPQ